MAGEVPLAGGVANAGLVTRSGAHVLRPSNDHSASIHELLRRLARAGFSGAPMPVGIDPDGRERLVFIEGDVPLPLYPDWAQTDDALTSIAVLMRAFHRASAGPGVVGSSPRTPRWSAELADPVPGPAGSQVVCHNDVCLENVVFRDGSAVALVDFDFAAPGRRVYDLAQMARMCVPVDDDTSASRLGWHSANRPARLRAVADAYGLDRVGRADLVTILSGTIRSGGEFVRRRVDAGDPNFIAMWNEMGGAERFDRRRRWWAEHRPAFASALA